MILSKLSTDLNNTCSMLKKRSRSGMVYLTILLLLLHIFALVRAGQKRRRRSSSLETRSDSRFHSVQFSPEIFNKLRDRIGRNKRAHESVAARMVQSFESLLRCYSLCLVK